MKTTLKPKDIVIIILFIFSILLILALGIVAHSYKTAKKLVLIWSDKAYVYKNKYDEEYAAKNTYILLVDDLKAYNDELYKEYKSIKDNPIVITKTDVLFQIDTIYTNINNSVFNDNYIYWQWNVNDSIFYSIEGESGVTIIDSATKEPYTIIYKNNIDARLTIDLIDDGKQLSIIAKTNNPYITLSNMESVVIDPANSPTLKNYFKQKHWGIGPSISAGILFGCSFDSLPIIGYGGCVGLSLHYDIFQW